MPPVFLEDGSVGRNVAAAVALPEDEQVYFHLSTPSRGEVRGAACGVQLGVHAVLSSRHPRADVGINETQVLLTYSEPSVVSLGPSHPKKKAFP